MRYLRAGIEFKRIDYSYGRRDYLRTEVRALWNITDRIATSFKLSRIDNDISDAESGYWLIYLTEELSLNSNLFLKLMLDSREGRYYNLLNSAKLKLSLEFITG
jgi:hypothetical protein